MSLLDLLAQEHADDAPADVSEPPTDAVGVRQLLIELAVLARRRQKTRGTLEAVKATYQQRLAALDQREAAVRSSLEVWCERHGKASFPDAGGCHLAQRTPALAIADRAAFDAWAVAHGFTRQIADTDAARAEADAVFAESGEVVPGLEWVQPEPTLVVRGPRE